MKRIQILIIILFLLPGTLLAQQDLLHPDRLWTMVEVHCQPQGNVYSSHYLKIAGDTIVEGFQYKKLDYSQDETQTVWYEYGGFLRETDDGKVYYHRTGLGEGLIYDFAAETGDTVVVLNYDLIPEPLHMVVILEDSILLQDGWHRMMILEDENYPGEETWIEGVGSISGLVKSGLSAFGSACGGYELLCTSDAGLGVYFNPSFPNCWYVSTRIDDPLEISTLKLYPNPTKGILKIEGFTGEEDGKKRVLVSDLAGKVVIDENLQSEGVDLSKLRDGMYFIQLHMPDNVYTGKVLKH